MKQTRKTSLDIIVPCYNEQECISLFFQSVKDVLEPFEELEFLVIFIDDGSTDQTLMEIRKLDQEKQTRIGYISFTRNFGKEAAIYAGLEASQGDYAVVMDCDLQHPPSLLPEMLRGMEEGYDCTAAIRRSRKGEGWLRSALSEKFYQLLNRICNISMEQNATDFRMMKREVVRAICSLPERDRFSKGLFSWVGYQTKWVVYDNVERAAGSTKWTLLGLTSYAVSGILSFTAAPLCFATMIGLALVAAGFTYAIFLWIRRLLFDSNVPGYASLMIMMVSQNGMIILLLGAIGEYLAKIFREVKKRPLYLMKEEMLWKAEGGSRLEDDGYFVGKAGCSNLKKHRRMEKGRRRP